MSFPSSVYEVFDIITKVGEGTFGKVCKARDKKTGRIVALKEVKNLIPDEGFPISSVRELKILGKLKHKNIINLVDTVFFKDQKLVFIVFDYCEYDLCALMHHKSAKRLTRSQVFSYSKQILEGVSFMHKHGIAHRDLKPANILINRNNEVKLADFGMAKIIPNPDTPSTNKVITIFYRPPELLLGSDRYSTEVDIWSLGCILYEIATNEILFRSASDNEIEAMRLIYDMLGTVPEKLSYLPEYKLFSKPHKSRLKEFLEEKIPHEYEGMIGILLKMLVYDPEKRITADDALHEPFFADHREEALGPLDIQEIHDLDIREKRRNKKVVY